MWLSTCIDVVIGLTLRTTLDFICCLMTTSLYWFIERILVPNITVDGFFDTLIWFLAPPILLMNLLSSLLPTFYYLETKYRSSNFRGCSSGHHGKRGRFTDHHNTWWHGSTYHNKYKYKEDSPRKKSRRQQGSICNKEREIRRKIDLLQYFDPIIIPPDIYVIDDDVFYDVDVSNCWLSDNQLITPSVIITTSSINSLVDSINVLSHYKQLQRYWNVSFLNSSYRRLDPSSTQFSSILIQARHLQYQVFHYDTTLANTNNTPEIYVSSNNKELPIVIDTGASSSITPIASDFTSEISKADLQELKQVNETTPVCGQGIVEWPIEDMEGVRRSIVTEAYFIPDAGIRLFSPQTYIGKDKTTMLVCDSNGVRFTLKCGTILHFTFNNSNNLRFMLTQASLKTQKHSHLLSSITTKSNFGIYNSLFDRSIFNRDNFNLNPAQQELLKWHCRWCHCDLNRVRMILSKPRQPKNFKESGEIVPQMVFPTVIGTTTCITFCCEACQYAKQKRKTPNSSTEIKNTELEGVLTAGDLIKTSALDYNGERYLSSIIICVIFRL
jgi:hypothetical protein